MKYRFEVTMDIPDNLERSYVQKYIAGAVAEMMGCHHPSDPILQARSVTVRGRGVEPFTQEIGYTFYDPEYDG